MTAITEDEYAAQVRGVQDERVHFEAQRQYDIGEEAGDLADWLDAMAHHRQPPTPMDLPWWSAYLDRARAMRDRGVRLIRIRVIDEPPTDYQRWGMWAAPWYAAAGEQVLYLTRVRAAQLGLPVLLGAIPAPCDWDVLDGQRVIITRFFAGVPVASTLIDDPAVVNDYLRLRDIALAYGTAATPVAA